MTIVSAVAVDCAFDVVLIPDDYELKVPQGVRVSAEGPNVAIAPAKGVSTPIAFRAVAIRPSPSRRMTTLAPADPCLVRSSRDLRSMVGQNLGTFVARGPRTLANRAWDAYVWRRWATNEREPGASGARFAPSGHR